jgi:hypothetical protein
MKKFVFIFAMISLAVLTRAQPPAGNAKPGDWYGEKITATGAVNIAELPARLQKSEVVETKIKAKVLEVCTKKGCWMKLQVNDSTTVFVNMKDYGFFVPLAAIGKTVVLDGEAKIKTTSVEELQHYAEDAKKSKEEIAAITKPEKEIRFTAKGILVVE